MRVETVGVLISSGERSAAEFPLGFPFFNEAFFVSRTFESAFLMNGPLFGAFLADFRTGLGVLSSTAILFSLTQLVISSLAAGSAARVVFRFQPKRNGGQRKSFQSTFKLQSLIDLKLTRLGSINIKHYFLIILI